MVVIERTSNVLLPSESDTTILLSYNAVRDTINTNWFELGEGRRRWENNRFQFWKRLLMKCVVMKERERGRGSEPRTFLPSWLPTVSPNWPPKKPASTTSPTGCVREMMYGPVVMVVPAILGVNLVAVAMGRGDSSHKWDLVERRERTHLYQIDSRSTLR